MTKKTDIQHVSIGPVEIQYAVVHKPKAKYKKPNEFEFKVDAVLRTKEEVEAVTKQLKELKVPLEFFNPKTGEKVSKLKTNADGNTIITFKRDAITKAGNPVTIDVVDSSSNEIPSTVLLGNGSKAIVHLLHMVSEHGEGLLRLQGLQVTKLVEYERRAKYKKVDGFTFNAMESSGEEDVAF